MLDGQGQKTLNKFTFNGSFMCVPFRAEIFFKNYSFWGEESFQIIENKCICIGSTTWITNAI